LKPSDLAADLLRGDRHALARAITLLQDHDPAGWEVVRIVYAQTGTTPVVGITGPPGVGKSTLIAALVRNRRASGMKLAVLSIDPSSPFSGGAFLGDRIRLTEHFLDTGVFIRSMASRGALGGLAEATYPTLLLMDAAGNDEIYLETVGVGQAEVDVASHVETVVLVVVPGYGESVQALKAGVMEIPDIIVVNKADHPTADVVVRDIRRTLALAAPKGHWRVPVLTTQASTGASVPELEESLADHRSHLRERGELEDRRRQNLRTAVMAIATAQWQRSLEAQIEVEDTFDALLDDVVARRLDPATAARKLSGLL
jgi:LAO/AO transport system kinase